MVSLLRSASVHLPVERTAAWELLVRRQSGAVSARQLLNLGVSADAAAAQVEAWRWQHPVRGVYVTFTGPLPRSTLISVALCYGGGRAVLSHRTAAEEWGLIEASEGP